MIGDKRKTSKSYPKVDWKPYRKVVVREWARMNSPQDLAMMAKMDEAWLMWAEGYGMLFGEQNMDDEELEMNVLMFCKMEQYRPFVQTVDGAKMPVFDVTGFPLAKSLAEWLVTHEID